MKCIDPKAGDADLWIEIWEELHSLISREILVEVEHVKAHRTEKDKKEMSRFERFVTDDNEKADELAKEGAMKGEGFMAQVRATKLQQEREEVYVASQCTASIHWVEEWRDCEELKPQPRETWIFVVRKERERSIVRNGVRLRGDIGARGVEEAASS